MRDAAKAPNGNVVLHPALLSLIYGGDPFLAANVEATRVITSGRLQDEQSLDFFVRLHDSVSRLNPCHEDAYYIAGAFLSWGGALQSAEKVIERAGVCRFWDAWPFFMQGFNQYFFSRDVERASASLNEAARRSSGEEATFFTTLAISFRAASFDELEVAVTYLRAEEKRARDPSLKAALGKRIRRLEGLSILRTAQVEYQKKFGAPLRAPAQLLSTGILKEYPADPLGVGYEFNNGKFELRQISMPGQGR